MLFFHILWIFLKDLWCFQVLETKLWLFELYWGVSIRLEWFGTLEYRKMKVAFPNIWSGCYYVLGNFSDSIYLFQSCLIFCNSKDQTLAVWMVWRCVASGVGVWDLGIYHLKCFSHISQFLMISPINLPFS